jgi:hypothetical protein
MRSFKSIVTQVQIGLLPLLQSRTAGQQQEQQRQH